MHLTTILALIAAFLSPFFYAASNIFDSYLSNRVFKHTGSIIFFNAFFPILFLPLLWLFGSPKIISLSILFPVIIIALIEILYQVPYYKSLQKEDTSIVVSLFALGKCFVPVLAFLIVKEQLHSWQYLGFFLIIASSALLTYEPKKKVRFNVSLFYMLGTSIILAFQTVLYKYTVTTSGATWDTVFLWSTLFSSFFSLFIFFSKSCRRDIYKSITHIKTYLTPFFAQNFCTWTAEAMQAFSVAIIPVTVFSGIESSQPLFVIATELLFANTAGKIISGRNREHFTPKKIVLYITILIGVMLIVKNGYGI